MTFKRRLQQVLNESAPKIVAVDFYSQPVGRMWAVVTYDDGLHELLFGFNPDIVSFSHQEIIGLTKQEALRLKDRKTDEGLGVVPPA